MLRIGAKKQLLLWKREKRFSPDLLKGLVLALGLHLMLLFGLRIASPPNPERFTPLALVAVEVDLGRPQTALLFPTQVTLSPIERIDPPQLLEIPQTQLVIEWPSFQRALTHEPDFSKIEKIEYELLKDLEEDDQS